MPKEKPHPITKMIKDHGWLVDFRLPTCRGPAAFHHHAYRIQQEIFTEAPPDGSSIRGWKVINASDMLVVFDPTTAWIDVCPVNPPA
jgi:glutamine synthetase